MKRFTMLSLACSLGSRVLTATGDPSHVANHTSLSQAEGRGYSVHVAPWRRHTHPKFPLPMTYFILSFFTSTSHSFCTTLCGARRWKGGEVTSVAPATKPRN